jgi:uncharacterized protein (TIGR00299 family) protein
MMSGAGPEMTENAPDAQSLSIHLDLIGGLAGDMFVAALVDAFPWLERVVLSELAAVRKEPGAWPTFVSCESNGFRALRFGLPGVSAGRSYRPAIGASPHAFRKSGHGVNSIGSGYVQLRQWILESSLASLTKHHASEILQLLAQAEAKVHGVKIEEVHFHEIADWDSLMDVVAVGAIAGMLPGAQWSASALPLGGGRVNTAHGQLPVPAPATAELLMGYPWFDDGVTGERITPTGGAILRYLVPPAVCDAPYPEGRMLAAGYGAGVRKLPGIPNIVRAMVFKSSAPHEFSSVAVLEFDVDDMTGEEIAIAADHIRAGNGVIDVAVGSGIGKKSRPISSFRVLATVPSSRTVAGLCFLETTTLGIRIRNEQRLVLPRSNSMTCVGDTTIGVKVVRRPDGVETAKAEHDDVAALTSLEQRRRLRLKSERKVLSQESEQESK